MQILITDIDSGEEETFTLKAPRKEQYLSDEEVRGRREFVIDAVILEGLKFMGTHRYIDSPNSRQNPEMYPNLSALSASECEAISRNIREETQAIGEALFHPPFPFIEEITDEEITDVWSSADTNPVSDLMRLQDSLESFDFSDREE